MRIYLIFPPVSPQFSMPYPSIPALGAFLKQEEPSWEVRMADLNIQVARKVLLPENIKRLRESLKAQLRDHPDTQTRTGLRNLIKGSINIERFLNRYRDQWRISSIQSDTRMNLFFYNHLKNIETWLKTMFSGAVEIEHLTQKETLEWVEKYPEGIMTEYFRAEVAPEIIAFNPDLIGFSWVNSEQVVPSLILLKILREMGYTRARTVVGGPFISLIWERLAASPLRCIIDHFVAAQGEEPLLKLARGIAKGESGNDIGQFLTPENPDISKLPVPDYGDFPLSSYLSSNLWLGLLGSWGCYWGKCSFCNVRKLERVNYKSRKAEQIAADMVAIKERYNPASIRLSDNAIPFGLMVQIAKELIRRNVGVPWITNSRFDGEWNADGVKLLAESHCRVILFGLESASPNIAQLVNKGIDLDNVYEILALLEYSSIHAHFYLIVGYPTETREDLNSTISFFKDISRRFPKLSFTMSPAGFGLQIQANMFQDPTGHKIVELSPPSHEGWSTLCNYRLKSPYVNIPDDPGIFMETKNKLDAILQKHVRRQRSLIERLQNRLWLLRMKINKTIWLK
jgi:hypothetical protein